LKPLVRARRANHGRLVAIAVGNPATVKAAKLAANVVLVAKAVKVEANARRVARDRKVVATIAENATPAKLLRAPRMTAHKRTRAPVATTVAVAAVVAMARMVGVPTRQRRKLTLPKIPLKIR
jgi:hypothetical protein